MGGSATISFAAKDKNVAGVCLWSTPHNLHSTFKIALGDGYDMLKAGKTLTLRRDDFGTLLKLEPDFIADFDNFDLLRLRKITVLECRLLVLHGSEDELVPLAQARRSVCVGWVNLKILSLSLAGITGLSITHQVAAGAVLNWLGRMFADNGGI